MLKRCARLLLALPVLLAAFLLPHAAFAADEFLEPQQAFVFSVEPQGERELAVHFRIADGYYMYRERFAVEATGEAGASVQLGTVDYPKGKVKYDKTFEKDVETHRGDITLRVPVLQASGPFRLTVTGQGCADKGLCYPPMPSVAQVSLKAFGAPADRVRVLSEAEANAPSGAPGTDTQAAQSTPAAATAAAPTLTPRLDATPAPTGRGAAVSDNEEGRLAAVLQRGNLGWIIALFLAAGVLLSLTPCVLPMVPILSSIIVGQGNVTRSRGFLLALSYALGMALLYTALGVAAGLAGEGLAAWLQQPWVLALFAALLVTLSLSMFGFYELQLPAAWRDKLSAKGDGLGGGQMLGVFAMGGLSALIVSPCVAAPLAGALLYISQSRDAFGGGVALFSLAIGMSVPLLVVGVSAGHVLPRSGAWMEHVKHVFGVLLIAVAIWMLQPVLPGWAAMLAWGSLLLIGATYLRVFEPLHPGAHVGWARLFKGVGVVCAVLGAIQLIGAASGGRDPLQPLRHLGTASAAPRSAGADASTAAAVIDAGTHPVAFQRVATLAELEQRIKAAGRPVMLDFYADWCVSCKEMERFTLTDARVQAQLAKALLLQVDVTANSDADRELLKRFHLFGPPGIVFFDAQGREIDGLRIIGFQDADRFTRSLQAVGL